MKAIVAIVLVGLLGFLGCSGGNDGTSIFNGQAVPVAPFGIIETPSPTYEWTPVPGATKYRLMVQETSQTTTMGDTQETATIDIWYTAEEVGCASEGRLCMVEPDTEVIGKHEFMVQACINENCGVWSQPLNFDFTAMNEPRFTDNGDDTVTDNNTQLMWTKNANLCGRKNWPEAISYCQSLELATHSDWRLPLLHVLRSLVDPDHYNPALPPGNPFVNVQSTYYWSSQIDGFYDYKAWTAHFGNGGWYSVVQSSHNYVWCVRGGH